MKKTVIAIVITIVACLCVFGTTLALLVDTTDPIVNTFTVGNVDITLTETDAVNGAKSFKMVPGNTLTKDPKITVVGDSEACWLFVKINESANFDNFMTYAIADGWSVYSGENTAEAVYYREVSADAANQDFYVLKGNEVIVKDTVTKAMMDDITAGTAGEPTLTFTAYAVQKDNVETAEEAWAAANP